MAHDPVRTLSGAVPGLADARVGRIEGTNILVTVLVDEVAREFRVVDWQTY